MRVFLTGGTGFIGRAVAARLRRRGDDVLAIVRDPSRAQALVDLGCEVVAGNLESPERLVGQMRGCDGVIHAAGDYRVGIESSERPAMLEANVGATIRVLDAASSANVARAVHISTVGVYGNTHERIVDESHRRDLREGFFSYYDETKYLAHVAAKERMTAGVPIVIVMPGFVYGPGDRSGVGSQLRLAHTGKLRYVAAGDVGGSFVHVDDVAAGIVAALTSGRVGETYNLGGANLRVRDALTVAARLGGRRLPPLTLPRQVARASAVVPAIVARSLGLPPDLGEVFRTIDGVTYWISSTKASLKLGYAPREVEAGLRDAFAAS